MSITIIGSGKVGASVALNCSMKELDDILLLDVVKGLPQGEAMDINHLLSERGIDCKVRGSNDYAEMTGSNFVVMVAGVGRKPGMTRMDLLQINAQIVREIASKIVTHARDAILIVVTNPLDPNTYLALKATQMKKNMVMGMGGMLDLSRFKSYIQEATNVSRSSINAMVISEHGENMLPLVRFSSIGGIPLQHFISEEVADAIVEKTKKVASEVIALKGATIHAPGNAVARMIEAVVKNKRSVIPISTLLEGEYGENDVCIGVPAIVGANGVEKIIELKLNDFEKSVFTKGITSVKDAIRSFSV
ncbi:MAG TPA: malate dehydrogenase [Candidatus Nitrosopolaris sp.]